MSIADARDTDWRTEAARRLADWHLFDTPEGRDTSDAAKLAHVERAATICRTCTVRDACVLDARETRASGIRAGKLYDNGRVRRITRGTP